MRDPDMARLHRCALNAAHHPYTTFLSVSERLEVALGAIYIAWIETVTNEDRIPSDAALYTAGVDAISTETRNWRRHHGIQDNGRAFASYWLTDDLDDGIVRPEAHIPHMALWQVFDALSESERETLMALAMIGNQAAAAEHLGITYGAMQKRVRQARLHAYALWFDWETPPKLTFDRRLNAPLADACSRGHEYTPENTRWRKSTTGRGRKRACRACDRLADQRRRERSAA